MRTACCAGTGTGSVNTAGRNMTSVQCMCGLVALYSECVYEWVVCLCQKWSTGVWAGCGGEWLASASRCKWACEVCQCAMVCQPCTSTYTNANVYGLCEHPTQHPQCVGVGLTHETCFCGSMSGVGVGVSWTSCSVLWLLLAVRQHMTASCSYRVQQASHLPDGTRHTWNRLAVVFVKILSML